MSPVSNETASRSDAPTHDSIIDSNNDRIPQYPSQVVAPTTADTVPQQASTSPGDGSEVHAGGEYPNVAGQQVPFKDQVIGYAKKTRGTLLGKPDLKDHGDKILSGQTPARRTSLS